jgi:hypothetical protein
MFGRMAADKDPRATVIKFMQLALRSDSEPEAVSALKRARKLVAKHELFDVLTEPASGRIDMAAAANAVDKMKDAAQTIKSVASDPDVLKGVGALTDLFRAGSEVATKLRGRGGRK